MVVTDRKQQGLTTYLSFNIYKLGKHKRPVEGQFHDVVVIKLSWEWLEEKRAATTAARQVHPISVAPTLFSPFLLHCFPSSAMAETGSVRRQPFPLCVCKLTLDLIFQRWRKANTCTPQSCQCCIWGSGQNSLRPPLFHQSFLSLILLKHRLESRCPHEDSKSSWLKEKRSDSGRALLTLGNCFSFQYNGDMQKHNLD